VERDIFIKKVRVVAGLHTPEQAMATIRAVLETMREHMAGREPHHLAAQLPPEIGGFLQPLDNADARGERFGLAEFYERVAEKAGITVDDARRHARAVIDVLGEAVSEGEMRDVRGHFSREYEALFGVPVRE